MSAEAVQSAPAVQDRVASYAARSHAVEGRVFHLSPLERAGLVKQGVPARTVAELDRYQAGWLIVDDPLRSQGGA